MDITPLQNEQISHTGCSKHIKGSITSWKIALLKVFKTLRRSNSRQFLKHGTNLVFIRESKYISFIWVNSILNLNFD